MFRIGNCTAPLAIVAALAAGGLATARPVSPVVVELFTSQGCNSCPPANLNIAAIAGRPGVLALSFGVTYWDDLGWKDTFAKEAFTNRQRGYAEPLGHSSPFTPQVVVHGSADVVGNRRAEIETLIAQADAAKGPSVEVGRRSVAISAGTAPSSGADVWLVRYDPRTVEVRIGRGENGGRTLPHRNVVHQLTRLGPWSGEAARFPIEAADKGLKTAILVQIPRGGPILGAATD